MGWAARAKVRTGNPSPVRLNQVFIDERQVREALRKTPAALVTFSDREYVMDEKGTLLRVLPKAPRRPAAS